MAKLSAAKQAELARDAMRFDLWVKVADVAQWVLVVVATWVPLQAVRGMVDLMAGKETVIDAKVAVSLSFAYSAVATIGWGVSAVKSGQRKRTLQKVRQRTDGLEAKLLGVEGDGER